MFPRRDSTGSEIERMMVPNNTYTTGANDDILVMELTGRIDEHTAELLFNRLESMIKEGRIKLILDCGQLQHISSVGLGTFVRIHSRVSAKGGP